MKLEQLKYWFDGFTENKETLTKEEIDIVKKVLDESVKENCWWFDNPSEIKPLTISNRCPVCKIERDGVSGYVCGNLNCPNLPTWGTTTTKI